MRAIRTNLALVPLIGVLALLILGTARLTAQQTAATPTELLAQLQLEAQREGWTAARHQRAAELWDAQGQRERAYVHRQAALTLAPDDPHMLRRAAFDALALQRWGDALSLLRARLDAVPGDDAARADLGRVQAVYDPQGAALTLAPLPRDPALDALRDLLRRADESPFAVVYDLGRLYLDAGDFALAELAFTQAVALGLPPAESLAYGAVARAAQGKHAQHWLDDALSRAPRSPEVQYAAGLYWQLRNDSFAALDALLLAAALDPDNPAFYAAVGQQYARLGDLYAAETWLQDAEYRSQGDPAFSEALRQFYVEYGPALEASNALLRVTDGGADPDSAEAVTLSPRAQAALGWSLYQAGNVQAARELIDAALARVPDDAQAQYYKANLLLDDGDVPGAAALLTQVADSGSGFAAAAARVLDGLPED